MFIGANVSIIAVGAILAFATRFPDRGFSVPAVGAVLMVIGVVSLVMQLAALARRRRDVVSTVAAPEPGTVQQYPPQVSLTPQGIDATRVVLGEHDIEYRL